MENFINNWHNISAYLAVGTALIAIFYPMNLTQKMLYGSITCLFLHFFEEFGVPGGFPWMGVKILLGSNEMDSTKWDCNNLNSMFGNWCFLILVYFLPLIFPTIRFLTLSAMIFNFLELFMHLILFNLKQKSFYNPGMITAVFGLTPISCYYFTTVYDSKAFIWYDYFIAVSWFLLVFWFCFRSPLYWDLGRKPGYPLTKITAYGIGYANKNKGE